MKSLIITTMAFSLFVVSTESNSQELSANQIIQKATSVQGGSQKLAAIQDQVTTWRMFNYHPEQYEFDFVISVKRPNKILMQSKNPDGSVSFAMGFDGKEGWSQSPEGLWPMQPEQIMEYDVNAETWIDGYHNYADKGYKVTKMPDQKRDGKNYHVLKVVDKHKIESLNYFNPKTGMLEIFESVVFDLYEEIPDSKHKPIIRKFSDFVKIDDVLKAKTVVEYDKHGKKMWQGKLIKLQNNSGIPNSVFAKPKS